MDGDDEEEEEEEEEDIDEEDEGAAGRASRAGGRRVGLPLLAPGNRTLSCSSDTQISGGSRSASRRIGIPSMRSLPPLSLACLRASGVGAVGASVPGANYSLITACQRACSDPLSIRHRGLTFDSSLCAELSVQRRLKNTRWSLRERLRVLQLIVACPPSAWGAAVLGA